MFIVYKLESISLQNLKINLYAFQALKGWNAKDSGVRKIRAKTQQGDSSMKKNLFAVLGTLILFTIEHWESQNPTLR